MLHQIILQALHFNFQWDSHIGGAGCTDGARSVQGLDGNERSVMDTYAAVVASSPTVPATRPLARLV